MLKLLIVDDEPFIYHGLRNMLNWDEYGIELCPPCYDATSAINYLSMNTVNILLTDIQMPELSGIGLLRHVKSHSYPIHCMVLSGYDDFEYVKAAALLGIENYFLKPINKDEFSNTITNIILKIQQEKELNNQKKNQNSLLQENFLNLWLNNNMEPSLLMEKATVAGMDIRGQSYCSVIFKLCFDEMPKKTLLNLQHDIQDKLSELMELNKLGFSVSMNYYEINLLLIGYEQPMTRESIAQNVKDFAEKLFVQFNIPMIICIGHTVNNPALLYRSFRKAKDLASHVFFSVGRFEIFFSTDVYAPQDHYLPNDCLQNIRLCSITKNWSGIINNLHATFSNIHSCDTHKLQNTFFVFMQSLFSELDFVNADADALLTESQHSILNNHKLENKNDLLHIVLQIITLLSQEHAPRSSGDNYVKILKDYVNAHYSEALSLKQLADMIQISPSYLGQMFFNEAGMSFSNYLNDFRVQKSKSLLRNTNLKVADISLATGFSTVNYFATIFKKIVDCTPLEYRTAAEKITAMYQ